MYNYNHSVYYYFLFTDSNTLRHCRYIQRVLFYSIFYSSKKCTQNYQGCWAILQSWHELLPEQRSELLPELLSESLHSQTHLAWEGTERFRRGSAKALQTLQVWIREFGLRQSCTLEALLSHIKWLHILTLRSRVLFKKGPFGQEWMKIHLCSC